jgi:hypothetical protein
MLWLVGLAAVCLVFRSGRMGLPAVLVLVATGVTQLEFPLGFIHVVTSDAQGVTLMFVRNGLLVAATLIAARRLWKETVPAPVRRDRRQMPVQSSAPAGQVSRDGTADTPASSP